MQNDRRKLDVDMLEKYFLNIVTSLTLIAVCTVGAFQVQASNRLTALETQYNALQQLTAKRYDIDDAEKDRRINELERAVIENRLYDLRTRLERIEKELANDAKKS